MPISRPGLKVSTSFLSALQAWPAKTVLSFCWLGSSTCPFLPVADDRSKAGPVISKPVSSEPSKSASPSPPPPLIAEAGSVLPAAVTLVHAESPVAVDTTEEPPPEDPADILEPISATTTVPGGPVLPQEAPVLDPDSEKEAAASPVLEPPPQPVLTQMPMDEEVLPVEPVTTQAEAPQPEELSLTLPGVSPTPSPSLEEASKETVESNGVLEEEMADPVPEVQPCQTEPAMESPIAQPEELAKEQPFGSGAPGKQEAEELEEEPESDISPISEPEEVKVEVVAVAAEAPVATLPAEEEEPEQEEEDSSQEPVEKPEQSVQLPAEPLESTEVTTQGECRPGGTGLGQKLPV